MLDIAAKPNSILSTPETVDPVSASAIILRRFGARAITLLTTSRTTEDGRTLPPRLSANDCYVAMEEACRKMARVAVRKYQSDSLGELGFAKSLEVIFPDPVAYLTRCIRSVVSDTERAVRRDVPMVSLEQPLGYAGGDTALLLRDTLADTSADGQPEEALIDQDERTRFRHALAHGLQKIPANYLAALERDMARDRQREEGVKLAPESDKDRQTIHRARAALTEILRRECGLDNPFVRLLAQQRSSRVRPKPTPSQQWTAERQSELFRRLLTSSWADRADAAPHADGDMEEAVINEVGRTANIAPPSPEMRQAMRVMDTYSLDDNPQAQIIEAQELYRQANRVRQSGKIEEAARLYRAAYDADNHFFAALTEAGVMLSQTGNLRDALKIYLGIVENITAGDDRYIAATNAADIYLTWYDAGRNREKNIEHALHYAQLAMRKPTPMRACNLVLAYVKDRYYIEARDVMQTILHGEIAECPAEKFLQTLFQIRDADLVAWWNWLDTELGKDTE